MSEMHVKYQGMLYMNDAEISSSYAWVESEGIFHFGGAEQGPGRGSQLMAFALVVPMAGTVEL